MVTFKVGDQSFRVKLTTKAQIEVCDGMPSDVEQGGVNFGGGRFCPWTAEIVSISPS